MKRIAELKSIKDKINELSKQERRLSMPILSNLGIVYNLYDIYLQHVQRNMGNPYDTDNRKKFVYAVVYCYSPATLVGEVMRHHLRETLSAVIGCTSTGVSRDHKTAQFFYDTYQSFREDTERLINEMLSILHKKDIS